VHALAQRTHTQQQQRPASAVPAEGREHEARPHAARPRSALGSHSEGTTIRAGGAGAGRPAGADAAAITRPRGAGAKALATGWIKGQAGSNLNRRWAPSPSGGASPPSGREPRGEGAQAIVDAVKRLTVRDKTAIGVFDAASSPAMTSPARAAAHSPGARSVSTGSLLSPGQSRMGKVERLRNSDTHVEELSRDHWMSKLDASLSGIGKVANGLPTFEDWMQKKKQDDARRSWAPKENKASLLRKSVREAELPPPPPPDPTMPDTVETLQALEKRIQSKIQKQLAAHMGGEGAMDVGVEPLLMEVQVYDGMFHDALKAGDAVCPAMASLLRLLWDSFAFITTESLRLQMKQLVHVQNENYHNANELRKTERQLKQLQAAHLKGQSTLERKASELTRCTRELSDTKMELERLRRVTYRAGVNANFDPFQLADSLEVLDEAEASNRHSQMLLGEMEKVLDDQALKDEELASQAYHFGAAMPARFRIELDKLRRDNDELGDRQKTLMRDLDSVTQSAEKYALMLQKTKVASETPRPDWNQIFETCIPHIVDTKIPGLVASTGIKDADYRGSTRDRIVLLCELLARMLPSEHLAVRPEVSNVQFFDPLGMGHDVKPYLRTKNPVRNKNVTKRDVESLTRAIFSTRGYQQVCVVHLLLTAAGSGGALKCTLVCSVSDIDRSSPFDEQMYTL